MTGSPLINAVGGDGCDQCDTTSGGDEHGAARWIACGAPTLVCVNIVLFVVLLLVGLPLGAAGVLGLRGTLPRNRFLGVRSKASLRDDETFALANRVAGVPNLVAAAVAVLAGIAALLAPETALVVGLVGLVGAIGIGAAGGVLGHRAAEAVPEPEPAAGCGGCACAGGGCSVLTRA